MADELAITDWHRLVESHGSPLNVLHPDPMRANIEAIIDVGRARGFDLRLHYAFKANKDIIFVETAQRCGIGIDVASEIELRRTLHAGVSGDRIVCTAAIKPQALIDRCLTARVTIVIDNRDEWDLTNERTDALGQQADVAIRLGGFRQDNHPDRMITRFGFDVDEDLNFLRSDRSPNVQVSGLHFHLDGNDASQRIIAIDACLNHVAELRRQGHPIAFLDIGGGFPARTFDDPGFESAADWLGSILDAACASTTIAEQLIENNVQLRCEPGRSLLDSCGMTIARAEFCKPMPRRGSGDEASREWLIGLAMNHTQCHPTHGKELADPILIPLRPTQGPPIVGRFVGDYCTEFEFLAGRPFEFPQGIERGDLVVFSNTAAYQMHFLESSSHQNPLADTWIVPPFK